MSGEYQIQTRRRSRSKTPFLRSTCDHENCEHADEEGHVHHVLKKKQPPTVQTIVEETGEISSRSVDQSRKPDISKSSENNSPRQAASTTTTTSSTTITSRKTLFTKDLSGMATTSTPKNAAALQSGYVAQFASPSTSSAVRQNTEISQNEMNSAFERSQRSAVYNRGNRTASSCSHTTTTSSVDLSKINPEEHIAYMEYRRSGEYWNKTPKTDYTYSELSPYRRELAPGVVAMPNMSRRSLEQHKDRVNYMVDRDPLNEEFIRRRYGYQTYTQQRQEELRRDTERLLYESGDELDYQVQVSSAHAVNGRKDYDDVQQHEVSWYIRWIAVIVTTVTTITQTLTGAVDDEYQQQPTAYYYSGATNLDKKTGFFGRIGQGLSSTYFALFRLLYGSVQSVLLFEEWLLIAEEGQENRAKKRFLLFALLLLALLGGWAMLNRDQVEENIERAKSLLPLSLYASAVAHLQRFGGSIRSYFVDIPLIRSLSLPAQGDVGHMPEKLKNSLSPEEYENLLNHVNSYVQELVVLRMERQQKEYEAEHKLDKAFSAQQMDVIMRLMHETMEKARSGSQAKATFTDEDLQRLAELVLKEIERNDRWSQSRKEETLAEVRGLIGDLIVENNYHQYAAMGEKIDLEALLRRLLASPELLRFVDSRIDPAVDKRLDSIDLTGDLKGQQQHEDTLKQLSDEVAFLKMGLSDRVSENIDLQRSIEKLELSLQVVTDRLRHDDLALDKRFSDLLEEIDRKLASLRDEQFMLLNQQIKLSLVEVLGLRASATAADAAGSGDHLSVDDSELKHLVSNIFVAKDYLEQRLLELNQQGDEKLKEQLDRFAATLMRKITERLKTDLMLIVESKQRESALQTAVSRDEILKMVKSELTIFNADKTGLADFALESAGGQVLSTRCTESYQTKSAQISVFGIPLWYPTNTPRVVISPNVQPGECWAFQGFPGFLVLKLNSLVNITGFTLEHIPKSLSPNGRIESAPRHFTVWGLAHEKDHDPVQFGEYEYLDNDAFLQFFPVQNVKSTQRPYELVELRIESNHGHPQYTCLYRFRVHGKPAPV